ncbi:MAG: L-alanine exporter AlaE [Nanoarchaeota archaeon]|nr:L-alanine exporter AlaE [Nanoarchaeota archaeon]
MKDSLKEKIYDQGKKYLVDTTSSLIYSNAVFTPIELLTTGGNLEEVSETRLKMSLIALAISRPYGAFRNFWSQKVWKVDKESSKLKKYASDVTANLSYYGGIYTIMALSSGRDLKEIGTALACASITTAVTGRPYGMFMDYCRKKVGIQPAIKSKNDLESKILKEDGI